MCHKCNKCLESNLPKVIKEFGGISATSVLLFKEGLLTMANRYCTSLEEGKNSRLIESDLPHSRVTYIYLGERNHARFIDYMVYGGTVNGGFIVLVFFS